ncbi:hypothetical protein QR90_08610 [Deinococcus radiopugnans]|uniref:Uncharacterized protein n=1 Tax=Deinococcus radiopugnans TaxID=57497 RepID=A0A0A7KIT5_9DEIO|nr:hypothetical protein [Deinococcus radiopugnans]AIZ45149.1 hypothetical protein QR90_08610 [Deinococcus radiopugnans]
METFNRTTALCAAQLITLLTLAWSMLPDEAIESRFRRASDHLKDQGPYVAENEAYCRDTGQFLKGSHEGNQIRNLLTILAQADMRLPETAFAELFHALRSMRHHRRCPEQTPRAQKLAGVVGEMLDLVSEVVVRLDVGSDPLWTWWDADVIDISRDGKRWLIQRVTEDAIFGGHSACAPDGYLFGVEGESWVMRVPAHIRTMEQADEALDRARRMDADQIFTFANRAV